MSYLTSLLPTIEADFAREAAREEYLTNPAKWAKDMLDIDLWSKQQEIGKSIVENRNTAVAAGHSVGKSFSTAVFMAWWVDVHPHDEVFIASTAPFQDQITAILWRELRSLHALSKKRYKEFLRRTEQGLALEEYKYNDHALPGYITGDNKWKLDDGTLIGQGRKPPDNKEDSGYQGLHAKYLFAVGDEAAGLSQGMIDALANITTGQHCRRLIIANPTDPTSYMAKIFKQNTGAWNLMHISVFDSPFFTDEDFPREKAEALVAQDYVDDKLAEYGEDSAVYISRVLGQWAFESGNNVFDEDDLNKAANTVVVPDPYAPINFGCDIARSLKGDYTAVYHAQEGDVWMVDPESGELVGETGERGMHIRRLDRWKGAPLTGTNPENLGSAERIHNLALQHNAAVVKVDAAGLGRGVTDGLLEIGSNRYQMVEIYGSGASSDKRAYVNIRVEQYFEMKKWAYQGRLDLDPEDTELFDELRGIVYEYNSNGIRKIESKDDMRKRGAKSPDHADACWYAFADTSPITGKGAVVAGEKVLMNPWDLLGLSRDGAGMPV